jgi:hypothetical protein
LPLALALHVLALRVLAIDFCFWRPWLLWLGLQAAKQKPQNKSQKPPQWVGGSGGPKKKEVNLKK